MTEATYVPHTMARIRYWRDETLLYEYVSQGFVDEAGQFIPEQRPSTAFTVAFSPDDPTIRKEITFLK